ncbi:MAG: hypothetical protein RJB66_1910 [Pseudomonadota bacterium]|jgi:hypothetical protein
MKLPIIQYGFVALLLGAPGFAQNVEVRSPDAVSKTATTSASAFEKTSGLPAGFIEKVYEGKTKVESPVQARRKIVDEATLKVSEDVVQSILGDARYKKNKSLIVDKVFRHTSRFIPVIKTSEPVATEEGQKVTVTLQINAKLLESLLQEQGLFSDNESAPMMIPFISIDDQVRGEGFAWWRPSNAMGLKTMGEFLESNLQKNLFAMGFYVQRPNAANMRLMIPSGYQYDSLTNEQIYSLCNRWGIPLVMTGDLTIHRDQNYEIVFDFRLAVTQVGTGRVLAQLYRQNKLSKNETLDNMSLKKNLGFVLQAYKDIGQQLSDAWEKGVLTATLVRLEVKGSMPINKYDSFKDALKASNRSIRQVRERVIASQSVLFELEINGTAKEIANSLTLIKAGDSTYRLKGLEGASTFVMIPATSQVK